MMTLDTELDIFEQRLPDLLQSHRGEFALVHGTEFVGLFPTAHAALVEGYHRFGVDEPFLVQEVTEPRVIRSSAFRRSRPE